MRILLNWPFPLFWIEWRLSSWTASTFGQPKFLGALFDFRHKLGFLGSWVLEMRLSQALYTPLLHRMSLIGIKHLGQDLLLARQWPCFGIGDL